MDCFSKKQSDWGLPLFIRYVRMKNLRSSGLIHLSFVFNMGWGATSLWRGWCFNFYVCFKWISSWSSTNKTYIYIRNSSLIYPARAPVWPGNPAPPHHKNLSTQLKWVQFHTRKFLLSVLPCTIIPSKTSVFVPCYHVS